jgi:hypothetical protein
MTLPLVIGIVWVSFAAGFLIGFGWARRHDVRWFEDQYDSLNSTINELYATIDQVREATEVMCGVGREIDAKQARLSSHRDAVSEEARDWQAKLAAQAIKRTSPDPEEK